MGQFFKYSGRVAGMAVFIGGMVLAMPYASAGTTCYDINITADQSKADGRSWDIASVGGIKLGYKVGQPNIGNPDIQVTLDGKSYPRVMDSFYWSRRVQIKSDQVYLSITDWDFFQPDGIGAGICHVPTNKCRLGQATIRITPCP